jgi:hypothetical protein
MLRKPTVKSQMFKKHLEKSVFWDLFWLDFTEPARSLSSFVLTANSAGTTKIATGMGGF